MATQTVHSAQADSSVQTDSSSLLRMVLRLDGGFSAIGGVTALLAAEPLGAMFGLEPSLLRGVGVGLLGYAALLLLGARRAEIGALGLTAVVLNALWVIGSAAILLGGWLPLTPIGWWAVALIADIVAVFGVAQFVGLRRLR